MAGGARREVSGPVCLFLTKRKEVIPAACWMVWVVRSSRTGHVAVFELEGVEDVAGGLMATSHGLRERAIPVLMWFVVTLRHLAFTCRGRGWNFFCGGAIR